MFRRRKRAEAEIPSASMADIAFELMIFFLVATTFDVDTGIGLVLPPAAETTEQVKVKQSDIAKLLVNAAGEVLLDGELITVPQIRETIKNKIKANPKLIISIKTDRETSYIEKIEAMGGAIKAIEAGYIQNEIAKSAYEYQMQIERKEKIIVGVNEFKTEEKQKIEIFKLNESAIKNQIERLKKLRKERDNGKVMLALKRLRESALLGENLIPPIIECVEAYATIGEISDTLREIWGEYREI